MRTTAIALVAATVSASCGPSPNNFVVVRLNEYATASAGEAACATWNMVLLELTTPIVTEVASLMNTCLGPSRYALIKTWNGVNFGAACLQAYVAENGTQLGVTAFTTCPPPQAVVCQKISGQPIIPPVPITSTTLSTQTTMTTTSTMSTSFSTSTVQGTTAVLPTTTTTTSVTTQTATIACMVGGTSPYVFLNQSNLTYDNAAAACQAFGYGLGFIDDLMTVNFSSCAPPGTKWWMQPTIANNFDPALVSYSYSGGTISNFSLTVYKSSPSLYSANTMCETTDTNSPYDQLYSLTGTPVVSSSASSTCSGNNKAFALYPITTPTYTNIQSSVSGTNNLWVNGLILPVPSVCAFLENSLINPSINQKLFFTTPECSTAGISGVLCQGPQL